MGILVLIDVYKRQQLGYPVEQACKILKVSRSAYYKWLNGSKSARETENIRIADIAEQIHNESPDKGSRRIRDDLEPVSYTHLDVYKRQDIL